MSETLAEYMARRPRLNISGQCVKITYRPWEGAELLPVYVPSELEVSMKELIMMQKDIIGDFF